MVTVSAACWPLAEGSCSASSRTRGGTRAQATSQTPRPPPAAPSSRSSAVLAWQQRYGGGRRTVSQGAAAPVLERSAVEASVQQQQQELEPHHQHPQQQQQQRQQPASDWVYEAALVASIRHTSTSAEELALQQAGSQPARLQAAWRQQPAPSAHSLSCTLVQLCDSSDSGDVAPRQLSPCDTQLQQWAAEAVAAPHSPGFHTTRQLSVPGVADAAVLSHGGRARHAWRDCNQDAFAVCRVDGAPGSPPALLLAVFDGHGHGGEAASQAAAQGLEGAVPSMLRQLAGGSGSSSSSDAPVAQTALVQAFQAVGSSMALSGGFEKCGTAAVACLVEPGSVTAVWAGDCRAVVGLSLQTDAGPMLLVHALTQDHTPGSPLEQARIAASGRGRVVQTQEGQPHRLCAHSGTNTLSLSRALGDTWATELGLTSEPDAITITLPAAAGAGAGVASAPASSTSASSSASAFSGGPLGTVGSSGGSTAAEGEDGGTASRSGSGSSGSAQPAAARHVLVLGCDGLFDMLSNEEAVDVALSCTTAEEATRALLHAAHRGWADAYQGSHCDDCTIAVAFLS